METVKLVWMDTETTGLNPEKHGIIELAMLIQLNDDVVDELHYFMNPVGRESTEEALQISGLTAKEIDGFVDWRNVKQNIKRILQRYVNPYNAEDKFVAAGYNVKFDLDMLQGMWKASGDKYLYSFFDSPKLDVLSLVAIARWVGVLDRSRSNTLSSVAKLIGIPFEEGEAHGALADIKKTRDVAYILKDKIQNRVPRRVLKK